VDVSAQPAFAIPAGAHPAPSVEAVHGPSLSGPVALQNVHGPPSCLHWLLGLLVVGLLVVGLLVVGLEVVAGEVHVIVLPSELQLKTGAPAL